MNADNDPDLTDDELRDAGLPVAAYEWKHLRETDRSAWHRACETVERIKAEKRQAGDAAPVRADREPPRTPQPSGLSLENVVDAIGVYVKKRVYPVFEAAIASIERITARVAKLEEHNAMLAAARRILPAASDADLQRTVDLYLAKGYTAGRIKTAPAPSIDWSKRVDVFIGDRKIASWDPAAHADDAHAEDEPTRDRDARLQAHAKHLQ